MQRALITGGLGLVGSHIADALVDRGVRVIVLDDLSRGRRENLAWAESNGDVRVVEGDIRDGALVERLLQGVDVVFHQAALRITRCAAEPQLAVDVLVRGTQTVLDAAVRAGVGKVVAASSASVYGMAGRFPTPEEHHPYGNDTLYGAAKAFDEGLLRSYHAMYGLDYVALRYFNVYGPRMDVHGVYTEVLVRWMERIAAGQPPVILGDGRQTMDFVHVADVARANLLAAESDVTDAVFNVASGTETSLSSSRASCSRRWAPTCAIEYGPARAVNNVARRLARHDAGAPRGSASRPRSTCARACAASWSGGAPSGRRRPWHGRDPDHAALAGSRGGARRGRRARLGLGGPGAAGRGLRIRGLRRARGRARASPRRRCTTALHLALHALGRGARRRRRGAVAVVHRYRQRAALRGRAAGVRRRRRSRRRTSRRTPSRLR